MSDQPSTPDLTASEVIIIGCVCAGILIILLIILIVIICRRRQRNKNYTNDPHSPRTIQQGNGSVPNQYVRGYDNKDNSSGDPYHSDKNYQGDLSYSGSPRTPTKDPQQFISVPEDHKNEGGSFGSGQESGYSTPDPAKPKKVIYEVVV